MPDSGDFDDALIVRSIETLYKVHDQPLVIHQLQENPLPWELDNAMTDALEKGLDTLICGLKVGVLLDFFAEKGVRALLRPIEIHWWQVLPPGGKSCSTILNQIAGGTLPSNTKIQYFARTSSGATWKSLNASAGTALSQAIKDSVLHKIPEIDDGYFKYKDVAGDLRHSIVVGLAQLGSEQANAFEGFLKLFAVRKASMGRSGRSQIFKSVEKETVWLPPQLPESWQEAEGDAWETDIGEASEPPSENDFVTTEEPTVVEPEDPSHWSISFANNQHLSILAHIDKYGCITEAELAKMLGSPRASRKFTLMLEEYSKQLPFDIKVQPSASGNRYTKVNS